MLSRTQSDWLTSISCCVTQSLLVLPNKTEPLVICAFPAITRGNCVCHLAIFPWRSRLPSKCSSEKNLDLKSYLLCPCPCSSQIPPQGGSRIHRSPMAFIQDTSAITAHHFYTIGCKKKKKKKRLQKLTIHFIRNRFFVPYWYDSITEMLQICSLYIHDLKFSFLHIPKMLSWTEIWWWWRPPEYSDLIVIFKKPIWDNLSFVTWHVVISRLYTVAKKGWI